MLGSGPPLRGHCYHELQKDGLGPSLTRATPRRPCGPFFLNQHKATVRQERKVEKCGRTTSLVGRWEKKEFKLNSLNGGRVGDLRISYIHNIELTRKA